MYEELLNQAVFVIFLAGALVPLYLARKFGKSSLGILSVTLALFLVLHGFYHLAESAGLDLYADVVFEPFSVVFLFGFAVYLYRKSA